MPNLEHHIAQNSREPIHVVSPFPIGDHKNARNGKKQHNKNTYVTQITKKIPQKKHRPATVSRKT